MCCWRAVLLRRWCRASPLQPPSGKYQVGSRVCAGLLLSRCGIGIAACLWPMGVMCNGLAAGKPYQPIDLSMLAPHLLAPRLRNTIRNTMEDLEIINGLKYLRVVIVLRIVLRAAPAGCESCLGESCPQYLGKLLLEDSMAGRRGRTCAEFWGHALVGASLRTTPRARRRCIQRRQLCAFSELLGKK